MPRIEDASDTEGCRADDDGEDDDAENSNAQLLKGISDRQN